MLFQLICQTLMCHIIFTDYNSTRCIHIDPVHDARTHHSINSGKMFLAVKHYCIDHCMGIMSGTWMNYHSFGFIDDQHIFIFIQNIQWNIFRKNVRTLRLRKFQLHCIGKLYFIICLYRFFIDCHISFFQ